MHIVQSGEGRRSRRPSSRLPKGLETFEQKMTGGGTL